MAENFIDPAETPSANLPPIHPNSPGYGRYEAVETSPGVFRLVFQSAGMTGGGGTGSGLFVETIPFQYKTGANPNITGFLVRSWDLSGATPVLISEEVQTQTGTVVPNGSFFYKDQNERSVRPVCGSLQDHSGTINSPNAFTVILSNNNRIHFFIQNLSETERLYVDFGNPAQAGAGSLMLLPGGYYESPSTSIFCGNISLRGTVGEEFTAKEIFTT